MNEVVNTIEQAEEIALKACLALEIPISLDQKDHAIPVKLDILS